MHCLGYSSNTQTWTFFYRIICFSNHDRLCKPSLLVLCYEKRGDNAHKPMQSYVTRGLKIKTAHNSFSLLSLKFCSFCFLHKQCSDSFHLLHLESTPLSAWRSKWTDWFKKLGVSIDLSQRQFRQALIMTVSSDVQSNTQLKTASHSCVWHSWLRYAI